MPESLTYWDLKLSSKVWHVGLFLSLRRKWLAPTAFESFGFRKLRLGVSGGFPLPQASAPVSGSFGFRKLRVRRLQFDSFLVVTFRECVGSSACGKVFATCQTLANSFSSRYVKLPGTFLETWGTKTASMFDTPRAKTVICRLFGPYIS